VRRSAYDVSEDTHYPADVAEQRATHRV